VFNDSYKNILVLKNTDITRKHIKTKKQSKQRQERSNQNKDKKEAIQILRGRVGP